MSKTKTEKPNVKFCWHCARKLRGNFYSTYTDKNGFTYIVHRQCKEELENGEHFIACVDEVSDEICFENCCL